MSRQLMIPSLSYEMLLRANFPPVGHVFHNRNEASRLFNVQAMLRCTEFRTRGVEVKNSDTTYKCNCCEGMMTVAFRQGRKRPGEVIAVRECTCPSAENISLTDPTKPLEAANEAGAVKALVAYLHFVHNCPITDATSIQPMGWNGNEPTAKVLYEDSIPAYASAGHKRLKNAKTKDYFLQLYNGKWFSVVLAEAMEGDKPVWVTQKIPEPLESATFPITTCLFPPADAEVLVVEDVLKIEPDICVVCLDNQSVGRLVCGDHGNPAVESSTGCKGSLVCDLCKTKLCLLPTPITHESTTYFIVPAARRELKCLHNCTGSTVRFFEPKGGDGNLLPLMFPFAQLWKRPFGCMKEVVEAAWAFDTFVDPIFKAGKEDLKEACFWRHQYETWSADLLAFDGPQGARDRLVRKIDEARATTKKLEERAELYRFPDWSEDLSTTLPIPKRMPYKSPEEMEAATAYYAAFDLGNNPRTLDDPTPSWANDAKGELWKYLNSKVLIDTGSSTRGSFWHRYGHATLPSDP